MAQPCRNRHGDTAHRLGKVMSLFYFFINHIPLLLLLKSPKKSLFFCHNFYSLTIFSFMWNCWCWHHSKVHEIFSTVIDSLFIEIFCNFNGITLFVGTHGKKKIMKFNHLDVKKWVSPQISIIIRLSLSSWYWTTWM